MKVGIHIGRGTHPTINTVENVRQLSKKHGFKAVQIFSYSPQQVKRVDINLSDLRGVVRELGLNLYIHSSYLVNPWNNKKPYHLHFALEQLRDQVAVGGVGVIFHIPKSPARDLVTNLRRLIVKKPRGSRVILENRAVRPDEHSTYAHPEQINNLVDVLINGGIALRDIHFAIDTAHLWCADVSFRDYVATKKWFKALKYPGTIRVVHLNGNSSVTHSDRHAIAFGPEDRIWGNHVTYRDSGVRAIAEFCKRYSVDIIIECDFEREYRHAKLLIKNLKKNFLN